MTAAPDLRTSLEDYSPQKSARTTGYLYLLSAVIAPFVLFYVPMQTRVPGNAAATAQKLLANETLFRSGLALGVFTLIIFLVVAILLYRLFKPVDADLARLMVVGVVVQVPIGLVLDTFTIASLMIFKGEALKELGVEQRQSVALLMLKLSSYGTQLLQSLWGLWLLPLGILVWKSRYMPRWLAVFVFLNGVTYVLISLAFMIAPTWQAVLQKYTFPLLFGELAFMVWMVIKTVNLSGADPAAGKPETNLR